MCILVSSCRKEWYEQKRLEQFKSMPQDIHIYYVFGKSEYTHDKVPESPYVHVLNASCGDYYEDITFKLWFGFSYLRNFYDVVIKIDENLNIKDAEKLLNIIDEESKTHQYGGIKGIGNLPCCFAIEHAGKVKNPLFGSMPAFFPAMRYAGSSYYLTQTALQHLTKKDFSCFLAEDYAIGYFLKKRHGIDVHSSQAVTEHLLTDMKELPVNRRAVPMIQAPEYLESYYCKIFDAIPNDPYCIMHVHGGLANQLFQIATGLDYSIRHAKRLLFTLSGNNVRPYYWDSVLSHYAGHVITALPTGQFTEYREKGFHHNEIPEVEGNVKLYGYFQSSKYFPLIAPDICKIIRLKQCVKLDSNIVIVHARRGDYMHKVQFHGPLTESYYSNAVAIMKQRVKDPTFVLFSDDPGYWKTISTFKDEKHVVYSDPNEINTLTFMSSAQNFIIANSTFSWWGAKLSGSKNVIAPAHWFGSEGPQDTQDIYESYMTLI